MNTEPPGEEYAFVGDITDYWTYTQVRDRLLLMPGLTDPAMRMYLIVRSMIAESKKNLPGQGLRRMTIDQMCFLLSRDTGKPVSVSLLYQILSLLEGLDLMVPLDTKQDVGASQLKGKEKAVRGILRGFVVRDLPPVPYTGWRNVWDKLTHYRPDWRENPPLPPTHVTTAVVEENGRHLSQVTQMPQDVVFQDSRTEPEGSPQEAEQGQDPFQDSGTPFQDSGTPFRDAGKDSPTTSQDAPPKQGSPTTLSKKNDAPSARSAADGRRPSAGSRRSGAGGSAASGNSKPTFSREEHRQYDAFVAALPAPLKALVPKGLPQPLVRAVLAATAHDNPAGRTLQQLIEYRLMPKWDKYYGSLDQAGPIGKPVGVLVTMLKHTAECQDPRCDERKNVDTGAPCISCEQRGVDKRAERQPERPKQPQERPAAPAKTTTYTPPVYVPQQATITPGLPKDIVAQARAGALSGKGLHRTSRMP